MKSPYSRKMSYRAGLLRFGIPNFKLGKHIIDRRIRIMEQEGILFRVNTMVGKEILVKEVVKDFDAVCVAIGARGSPGSIYRGTSFKRRTFRLGVIKPAEPDLRRLPTRPKARSIAKARKS